MLESTKREEILTEEILVSSHKESLLDKAGGRESSGKLGDSSDSSGSESFPIVASKTMANNTWIWDLGLTERGGGQNFVTGTGTGFQWKNLGLIHTVSTIVVEIWKSDKVHQFKCHGLFFLLMIF